MTGWHALAGALAICALCWMSVERERTAADLEMAKMRCVAVSEPHTRPLTGS